MPPKENQPSSVRILRRQDISRDVERQLFGRCAGRCQFPGCNIFLLEHHVTGSRGNFGQKAHIVAFADEGPRGSEPILRSAINNLDNLMLLCHRCHQLIDDDPDKYPVALLKQYKAQHENRIYAFTDFRPEVVTTVLTLEAQIRGQVCRIPDEAIVTALNGLHFDPRVTCRIDLLNIDDRVQGYWSVAQEKITDDVRAFLKRVAGQSLAPLSVFATARLPLLVHLGFEVSSKLPVRIFNRQILHDDFTWRDVEPCEFEFSWLNKAATSEAVLLVSLSGQISLEQLPPEIVSMGSVMELTIMGSTPSRTCLETEASLKNFSRCYLEVLQELRKTKLTRLHVFVAAPIAAGISIGRLMLPTIDPPALIYDWTGDKYEYTLTVNND